MIKRLAIFFCAFFSMTFLCNAQTPDPVVGQKIKIVGDGGQVIQDTNGLLYVSVLLRMRSEGSPAKIQPWWRGSYEIDRNEGNVSIIPVPISTMPPTNSPELKELLISSTWQSVQVPLTAKNRGDLWRLRPNTESNHVSFRMRYKSKDVISNWEAFDLSITKSR
jgi:hypothetical protein